MKTVAIVSVCDDKYFPLAKGLIKSINYYRHHWRDFRAINTYIIDIGLESEQITWLNNNGCVVKKVTSKYKNAGFMMAYTERPYINQHFPGHDVYLWLDCDTWIQDYRKATLLMELASLGYMAAVPEMDASMTFKFMHLAGNYNWAKNAYTKFFSEEVGNKLASYPMFNGGVFAIPALHPMWQYWDSAMQFAYIRNNQLPDFAIDQMSFNYCIYANYDKMKFSPLPFTCNWAMHAVPPYLKDGQLVSPVYPHEVIGIPHLTGNHKWQRLSINRVNKDYSITHDADLRCLEFDYFSRVE